MRGKIGIIYRPVTRSILLQHIILMINAVHVSCLYQVLTVGPFICLLFSHTRENVSRVISLKQKGFGFLYFFSYSTLFSFFFFLFFFFLYHIYNFLLLFK
jgi:hypothetical protein